MNYLTLKQIEKIRETIRILENLKDKPTPQKINEVDSNLENFFHDQYKSPSLSITAYFLYDTSITKGDMINDIESIIATLEGMIAVDPQALQIAEIIDLIDEGDSCVGQNFNKKQKFLAKVFYTYSGKIDFDKSIEDVARRSINSTDGIQIDLGLGEKRIDDIVISGVVSKLRVYAQTVIDRKTTTEKTDKKPIIINNNATANATVINNNAIDLSVVFQNARQKVDDEGLSDLQTKEITEKLNELEKLMNSSESKGNKWTKIKDVMKWLVEQGITVAGIIMPVLTEMMKQ